MPHTNIAVLLLFASPYTDLRMVVLFDLDGTLVDSFALIVEAFRHACRTVLGREATREEVLAHWGKPLRARFAPLGPDRVELLLQAYTRYYTANLHRVRPFPRVPEMLAELRRRGIRIGVVTSKRGSTTEDTLQGAGLRPLVDAVTTADDVRDPKPAPDPILLALHRFRALPKDAWMVGDGPFDVEAGRAAGVRTIAALWGTREQDALLASRPDYAAETPDDVVRVVVG